MAFAAAAQDFRRPGEYPVTANRACVLFTALGALAMRSAIAVTLAFTLMYAGIGQSRAANAAAFVSQSVPSTMALGQTYQVSVTMQNTGDTTWDSSGLYGLGSQNPQDNNNWGIARVELPASVAPGASVTFNFSITAPNSIGTYNFQWRMVQDTVEWFGAPTDAIAVKDGVNNATFVSQNVPGTMTPGQTYPITVTMQNTGNTTWSAGSQYRLGTQNPQDNSMWGLSRVDIPNSVAPGESVTFAFNVTAPQSNGTYNFQWQMVDDGLEWFGDTTSNIAVKDGDNNATFISQSIPSPMVPGQSYPVTVTMRNSGNTTWTAGDLYRLGSQNLQDNSTWGLSRVELPSSVAPGSTAAFNFNITAPTNVGTYNFQWKMVQDNVEWFGDASPNVAVVDGVNSAGFISQSVPSVMVPGQTYAVSVTMANTGNTTWNPTDLYRLGSQNNQDNTVWGLSRVELPSTVPPGSNVTFQFNVTAPNTFGLFNFQWQMVQDGIQWFGDSSPNVSVHDGLNDSVFVSQNLPSSMIAGQAYPVTITMQNTGNTIWTGTKLYRLGAQAPQDNTTWGLSRVELPVPVPPGSSVDLNFTVTAPATPGVYNLQWRMVEDTVEWFGGYSNEVAINVQATPPNTGALSISLDGIVDGGTLYEGTGVDVTATPTDTAGTINSVQILIDGLMVASSTADAPLQYGWTPLPLGQHVVQATAVDDHGSSASVSKTISVVIDPQDIPFRNTLSAFKSALTAGDKATAMTLLSDRGKTSLGPVLDALAPYLPQIVSEWSDPRRLSATATSAEYAVTRMLNGTQKVYLIDFVLDANGNWVIDSM